LGRNKKKTKKGRGKVCWVKKVETRSLRRGAKRLPAGRETLLKNLRGPEGKKNLLTGGKSEPRVREKITKEKQNKRISRLRKGRGEKGFRHGVPRENPFGTITA